MTIQVKQNYIPIWSPTYVRLSKHCLNFITFVVLGFFSIMFQFKQKQKAPQISLESVLLQDFQILLGYCKTFDKYNWNRFFVFLSGQVL